MHTATASSRFIRNHEVVSRQIEGELVIVPIRRGVGDLNSLYTLNPVGSVLWDLMSDGCTLSEMVRRICDEFEVSATQARQDIEQFLDSMMDEKLIQSVA
jgi:Coenzyme PQQ synthesis protein D (PqqD)